jgi:hypothetical protein
MTRFGTAVAFVLALALATASPASAAIDDIVSVTKGTPYTWDGDKTLATNENYFGQAPATDLTPTDMCTKDLTTYCEVLLFKVNNPITATEQAAGVTKKTAKVRIAINWAGTPVIWDNAGTNETDFDLLTFASSELGEKGEEIVSSAQGDTTNETAQFTVQTTVSQPSVWVLVQVVYFQVPNADGYAGSLTFPN